MISVFEVVPDPDMVQPEAFTIQRSVGQWVAGGFQSTVVRSITVFGPVRVAQTKDIAMLPESDRVSQIKAFYATQPMLVTRGAAPVPSTHGEVPGGLLPGTVFVLSSPPPGGGFLLTLNGLGLTPGAENDYTLGTDGVTVTMNYEITMPLYASWPITAMAASAESDILLYDSQQWRVLSVYRVSGSGYWKALGTRLSAS